MPWAWTCATNTYGWCIGREHHSTRDCFKICELYHHHVQQPTHNLYDCHRCVGSFEFPSNNLATLKRISEQSRHSSMFYSIIGEGILPFSKHTLWIPTGRVPFPPVPSHSLLLGLPIFWEYTGAVYLPFALISLLCPQYFYLFLVHWTLPRNLQTSVHILSSSIKKNSPVLNIYFPYKSIISNFPNYRIIWTTRERNDTRGILWTLGVQGMLSQDTAPYECLRKQ